MLMLSKPEYIGRFAPSPTGSLHLGSLLAALASYCDALKNNGQWLLRIEDIDPPREIKGATESIINTLHNFGFQINQPILFQSQQQRQEAYLSSIDKLLSLKHLYSCPCSRAELKNISNKNHSCRTNQSHTSKQCSLKLRVPDQIIRFNDSIQGLYQKNLLSDLGDPVLKRKDGLIAYQLAVVVDDAYQGVNNIVRGIDIIDSTPWQIYLNSLLAFKGVKYAHIPILVNSQGQKLSKQTFAKKIDNEDPLEVLLLAYSYLNQSPFIHKPRSLNGFWSHAIQQWNINKITKADTIQV